MLRAFLKGFKFKSLHKKVYRTGMVYDFDIIIFCKSPFSIFYLIQFSEQIPYLRYFTPHTYIHVHITGYIHMYVCVMNMQVVMWLCRQQCGIFQKWNELINFGKVSPIKNLNVTLHPFSFPNKVICVWSERESCSDDCGKERHENIL